MQLPKRNLRDTPLRPEPHVQAVIEKEIIPPLNTLPEPEPVKSTKRLNVEVDSDLYEDAIIKARRQNKRLSDVVRQMLVEYLSK